MNLKIFSVCMIAFLLMLVSGCVEEKKEDEVEIGEGTLRLQITDKPGDLDILHANVTISMVEVHKAGANDEDEDGDENEDDNNNEGFTADAHGDYEGSVGEDIQFVGTASGGEEPYNWSWDFGDSNISYEQSPEHSYTEEGVYTVNLTVTDNTSATAWDEAIAKIGVDDEDVDSEAGWYTIANYSQTFDLIGLQNVTELLGEKNLSAGKYTQIRLTIEQAIIIINNSGEIEEHNLTISSSKVKLIKSFWIYENNITVLTLDFDANESVHKTGSDKYIMKPTIKVIQE